MLFKSQFNFFVWRTCAKVQNQATCSFLGICYANSTRMEGDICSTCCESYGCSQGPIDLGTLSETSAGCYDLPYAPLRSGHRRTPDAIPSIPPERTQHQSAPQPDLRAAEHKERLTSGFAPAQDLEGATSCSFGSLGRGAALPSLVSGAVSTLQRIDTNDIVLSKKESAISTFERGSVHAHVGVRD